MHSSHEHPCSEADNVGVGVGLLEQPSELSAGVLGNSTRALSIPGAVGEMGRYLSVVVYVEEGPEEDKVIECDSYYDSSNIVYINMYLRT